MTNKTATFQRGALVLSLALAFGSPAFAQTGTTTTTNSSAKSSAVDSGKSMRDWERRHRVSKIMGTDIRNKQGEKIGDVKDVVLDSNGNVAYAVVSTGGFLGVGDRLHAVPWKSLQTQVSDKHFVLDIDKKRLSAAPGFPSKSWPNFTDEKWMNENTRAY